MSDLYQEAIIEDITLDSVQEVADCKEIAEATGFSIQEVYELRNQPPIDSTTESGTKFL